MSLGMRFMAWSTDDDKTALCNFGDFGRFVRMRRKQNKSDFLGFNGYGFLKAKTFGMYSLPTEIADLPAVINLLELRSPQVT